MTFFRKSGRRITVDFDDEDRKDTKRPRLIYDVPGRRSADEPLIKKPTVQSSVRLMTIETKSREQTIADRKNSQKEEDGKRYFFTNMQLFS